MISERENDAKIQMMTGTAAATLPTSSSPCMIFLIRAYINTAQQFMSFISSTLQYSSTVKHETQRETVNSELSPMPNTRHN